MKPKKPIGTLILTIRGQKVILDAELARLYGAPTHRFNEAFKRNQQRFPDDFAFQLTAGELADLKSQLATSSAQPTAPQKDATNSSQIAMSPPPPPQPAQLAVTLSRHRGASYRPWAFTEHGALMAANILHSQQAVEMSVFVIRAFVRAREQLAANAAILKRLAEIDKSLLEHDTALRTIWSKLQPLLAPPPDPPRRRIGFKPDDAP